MRRRTASWFPGALLAALLPLAAPAGVLADDPGLSRIGVMAGGGSAAGPEIASYLTDLGARWVRINLMLDGQDPDPRPFLDAGVNVVLTLANRDPSNVVTAYGTLAQWPNAGFPHRTKAAYQARIREALAPLLDSLASGRQVWVQCENEISDASVNPDSRYWRGTVDQYVTQLQVLYEAVRSIDPSIPVVLSSFASGTLDALLAPGDPRYQLASALVGKLLAGAYDAADLHFYGCVEDIPAKAQSIQDRLPPGRYWISTENGGPDSRCDRTPATWDQDPSLFEQTQAQQVSARLIACLDAGGEVCLWFSLFDLHGEVSVFAHLGLLDPSVLPPRRKPAYDAFQRLARFGPVSVSAASFAGSPLAPESIAAAFGSGLASVTLPTPTNPPPTSLGGTTVTVRDSVGAERAAPLFYVSPSQVNFLIPPGTASGLARVTIRSADGSASSGWVRIEPVAPGLFSANGNGQGVAAANLWRFRADQSQSVEPVAILDPVQNIFVPAPIDLGPETDQLFLVLYGTGLRYRGGLANVVARIGGVQSEVLYAGPQNLFPGLDQVNVRLPRSLKGRGEVPVVLTVDAHSANTLTLAVR